MNGFLDALLPFHSQESPKNTFSSQHQYNIKQTRNGNMKWYQLGDCHLFQHLIIKTKPINIFWQTVSIITKEILGVNGSRVLEVELKKQGDGMCIISMIKVTFDRHDFNPWFGVFSAWHGFWPFWTWWGRRLPHTYSAQTRSHSSPNLLSTQHQPRCKRGSQNHRWHSPRIKQQWHNSSRLSWNGMWVFGLFGWSLEPERFFQGVQRPKCGTWNVRVWNVGGDLHRSIVPITFGCLSMLC